MSRYNTSVIIYSLFSKIYDEVISLTPSFFLRYYQICFGYIRALLSLLQLSECVALYHGCLASAISFTPSQLSVMDSVLLASPDTVCNALPLMPFINKMIR